MTCYGVSTRLLAACLSTHGDNSGLVNPPMISQYQVLLLPVVVKKSDRRTVEKAHQYARLLRAAGVRVVVDDSAKNPGDKFFHWELRGVPLRLEVGPRDLAANQVVLVPRDDKSLKSVVSLGAAATPAPATGDDVQSGAAAAPAGGDVDAAQGDVLVGAVRAALSALSDRLRAKAFAHHSAHTTTCTGTLAEVKELLYSLGGFVRVPFHSMGADGELGDKLVHEATGGEVRGYVPGEPAPPAGTLCIATGKPAASWGYVARAY
jgi:prolyl-tRNA synthetase